MKLNLKTKQMIKRLRNIWRRLIKNYRNWNRKGNNSNRVLLEMSMEQYRSSLKIYQNIAHNNKKGRNSLHYFVDEVDIYQ